MADGEEDGELFPFKGNSAHASLPLIPRKLPSPLALMLGPGRANGRYHPCSTAIFFHLVLSFLFACAVSTEGIGPHVAGVHALLSAPPLTVQNFLSFFGA